MQELEWQTGEISFSVQGKPFVLKISVPVQEVTAEVMLPVFQQMANEFTDLAVASMDKHLSVSCKKGCGACCCQPVPLAEIEVYHIARLVSNLPESRRTQIEEAFKAGAAHFEGMGWFDRLAKCEEESTLHAAILDYFFQSIPCPFLTEGSCSIYEDRPIACREYLVTSDYRNCSEPYADKVLPIPLPINVSDGIRNISRGTNLPVKNFIPFIQALELAAKFPEKEVRKTGEEWLSEFFS